MVELVLNKELINSIPSVIGDKIMNQYWSGIYFDNIELLKNTEYILDKILMFIIKHIINDYERLFGNQHLHYYFFKYNEELRKLIKDKGLFLLLKKSYNIHFEDPDESSTYKKLSSDIRYLAIVTICLSNFQRYTIFHNFMKFNHNVYAHYIP